MLLKGKYELMTIFEVKTKCVIINQINTVQFMHLFEIQRISTYYKSKVTTCNMYCVSVWSANAPI